MLLGDFYSYEVKSLHSGGDPFCKLCFQVETNEEQKVQNTCHILISCKALANIRYKYFQKYRQLLNGSYINLQQHFSDDELACQFILDQTSINLKNRIPSGDPIIIELFQKDSL